MEEFFLIQQLCWITLIKLKKKKHDSTHVDHN